MQQQLPPNTFLQGGKITHLEHPNIAANATEGTIESNFNKTVDNMYETIEQQSTKESKKQERQSIKVMTLIATLSRVVAVVVWGFLILSCKNAGGSTATVSNEAMTINENECTNTDSVSYTVKSTGEYYVGSFNNEGLPLDGKWYDKRGKEMGVSSPIEGDFNGDGEKEQAYMTYLIHEKDFAPADSVITYIHFTNEEIPVIVVEMCLGGYLQNLGDLNNDKRDEIGLWRGWYSSCWHTYSSWQLKGNAWHPVTDDHSIHCSLWDEKEEGFLPIQKIDGKRVRIYYSDWENEYTDLVVKSEIVSIKE